MKIGRIKTETVVNILIYCLVVFRSNYALSISVINECKSMANKKAVRGNKSPFLATLVTNKRAPCAFCQRKVDDEITYGKLYAIGEIQCHYFCVVSTSFFQRLRCEPSIYNQLTT